MALASTQSGSSSSFSMNLPLFSGSGTFTIFCLSRASTIFTTFLAVEFCKTRAFLYVRVLPAFLSLPPTDGSSALPSLLCPKRSIALREKPRATKRNTFLEIFLNIRFPQV